MQDRRFLGITVLGDFLVSEGVEAVLANLERVGATAVATNPTVTAPAAEGQGSFQPPSDAGTSPRVFDRPLFGRRALWVQSGPSYVPRAEFYRDSPYAPRQPSELTAQHGDVIGRFIDAALEAGLKVYFQLGAVQPPQLRDDDRPRLPDGHLPQNRMADTGSLASEAIRAYNRAYVRDLLAAYPRITGFRPDWPEYPCYTLGEAFQDFSPHVARWAPERGFDFEAIRAAAGRAYMRLHGGLTNDDLRAAAEGNAAPRLCTLLDAHGLGEWLRLKSALVDDLLRHWRAIIDEAGGSGCELAANAFMPPWAVLTGFCRRDATGTVGLTAAAGVCEAIAPKLYTMHWSLMVEFWGRALLAANPGLDERLVVRALVGLFDIADDGRGGEALADYGYPGPDEPHPVPDGPQRRKIGEMLAAAGGRTAVYPLVHGYGPPDDFARRLRLVAESGADGVWINRYGYLSDEKLASIGGIWR